MTGGYQKTAKGGTFSTTKLRKELHVLAYKSE
jgi:hypothetical protein